MKRKVTFAQLPLVLFITTVTLPVVAQETELEVDTTTGEIQAVQGGQVSEGAVLRTANEIGQAVESVGNQAQQVINDPIVQNGVGAVGQVGNAIENPSLESIGGAVEGIGNLAGSAGLEGISGTLGQIGSIASGVGNLIGGFGDIAGSIQNSINSFLASARQLIGNFSGGNLSKLFPSLNDSSFGTGVRVILEDLQEVLPFFGSQGGTTENPEDILGVLGIPDFDQVAGDIFSRGEIVDETILSLGITDNTIDPSTQYYKTEAIATTFEGLSNEFLSLRGQMSTMDFLNSTKQVLQDLDSNVVVTGDAVARGLQSTTSFDRLGVLLEERKLSAIRDQQTASLLEAVLLSNERVAPLLAADVMLASREQQMQNRELVQEQRQKTADIVGQLVTVFPPLPSGLDPNNNNVTFTTVDNIRNNFSIALPAVSNGSAEPLEEIELEEQD